MTEQLEHIARGQADAIWVVNLLQNRTICNSSATPTPTCDGAANLSSRAQLLDAPAESSAAGPADRAELLRRALTSPWRLLAPRRAAHACVERSCHAFGATSTMARGTAGAAVRGDISAPGRVDWLRPASGASERSLFTIDGMPSSPASGPSILAIPQPGTFLATSGSRANADCGSSRRGPSPLQRVNTTPGAVDLDSVAEPVGPPPPPPPHQIHHQQQQKYANLPYNRAHIQGPERSWHRLAGSSGPAVPYGLPCQNDSTTHDVGHLAEWGPATAAGGERRTQPPRNSLLQGGQQQHLPSPPPPPQPQQPATPAQPQGSSTASGAGLLESMHNLMHQPGGTTTRARQTGPAIGASGPSPQPGDGNTGIVPAGAGEGSGGGAAAAPPALPGPEQLHWDDARNPMSFRYNPSSSPGLQPHPQKTPMQECRKASPYGVLPPTHDEDWGRNGAMPSGPAANYDAPTSRVPAASNGRHRDADASAGGVTAAVDAAAVDGVEVVSGEGPFVVLEMKGPRGTPSTHAAALGAVMSGASASPAVPDAAAAAAGMSLTLRGRAASYFSKWLGVGDTLMPPDHPVDVFWSWLGAFLSILAVAVLHQYLTPRVSLPLMIASFGASAVLLFGVPASKLAQPRNFLGGQVFSAIVGVAVRLAFMHAPQLMWLSAALGMSLALAAMQITRTVHPPGGASALIAASAPYIGPWYGFKLVLTVFFGSMMMLAVALAVNNLSARRRYPTYWLGK